MCNWNMDVKWSREANKAKICIALLKEVEVKTYQNQNIFFLQRRKRHRQKFTAEPLWYLKQYAGLPFITRMGHFYVFFERF